MSNRTSLFLGALAGVLLLALVAGVTSLLMGRPAMAQPEGVPAMRQITVVGTGEVNGTPDTARVTIGVETTAPTTQAALDQNSSQVAAVIDRLTALGIAEEDIQTRDFNIHARYDNEGNEIEGYVVNNSVHVTIRNLDQAGTLLDEVVQVGANRIYGIQFSVDDPSALLDNARENALADAREKATQMADVSGASLGEVLVITENIGEPGPMPVMGRGGGALAEDQMASAPIQAGEQSFTARVQVTFALR